MVDAIKIEGMEDLNRALKKFGGDAEKEVMKALEATGLEARGEITKGYNRGPASGHVYKIAGPPKRTHQASAPGEAPQTDTGNLASHTVYRVDRTERLSVEVENKAKTADGRWFYGWLLEYGTRRISPRPLWRPVRDSLEPKMWRRVRDAVAKATRKANG